MFRALRRGALRAADRARDRPPARERARSRRPASSWRRSRRRVPAPPARFGGGHPAKRVFQAIRIAVNDELGRARPRAARGVGPAAPGGRLAAISFHSLEDRRVKRFLADRARGCICPPDFPVCACGRTPEAELLTRRAVAPDARRGGRQPARAVGAPARGAQARASGSDGRAPPDGPRRRAARRPARRARPARPPPAPTRPRRAAAGRAVSSPRRGARAAARPARRARAPCSTASCAAASGSPSSACCWSGSCSSTSTLLELNREHRRDEPSRRRRSSARTRACACELARLGSSERIQRRPRCARPACCPPRATCATRTSRPRRRAARWRNLSARA